MATQRNNEGQPKGLPVGLARVQPEKSAREPTWRKARLTHQGRLMLGVVVAGLPTAGAAAWLARETDALWAVWLLGLLSLGVGLAIVYWANRPIAGLIHRARAMAGAPESAPSLFGLIQSAPRGDQVLSEVLDRIEQSLQEIRALNHIGQLVASDEDLERILTAIVEEAVALARADAGLIGSWDAERMVFRDVAACNLPIMFHGREFGIHDSFSSEVASRMEVLILDDYMSYPNRLRELDRFELHAGLGAPMAVRGRPVGALVVFSTDQGRRFSALEGHLLATFASQAGAAFEKARLHQLTLHQIEELTQAREELARESQELERALANMVRVQEAERARIAADVHDGVVQMMVGGLCELQAAMAHSAKPGSAELVKEKQARARELVRDSITELRRVIFDLRPITLDTAGLVPAVQGLAEDLSRASGPGMRVSVAGIPCRFPPEAEIGAYRIIQEAVNNAAKHAQAASVEVRLWFGEATLEITVSDDGLGFSVEEATPVNGRHAGLIGMQERARSLGGRLSVESTVRQGTIVRAVLPCRASQRTGGKTQGLAPGPSLAARAGSGDAESVKGSAAWADRMLSG